MQIEPILHSQLSANNLVRATWCHFLFDFGRSSGSGGGGKGAFLEVRSATGAWGGSVAAGVYSVQVVHRATCGAEATDGGVDGRAAGAHRSGVRRCGAGNRRGYQGGHASRLGAIAATADASCARCNLLFHQQHHGMVMVRLEVATKFSHQARE